MDRVLVIDQDLTAPQRLGLACRAEGVAVARAETLCEGVRALLSTPVSLVAVDRGLLRLTPREHAILFERVAPGVPVVVVVRADTAVDARVAFELAGFRVLTRPPDAHDLVEKSRALALETR